VTRPLRLETLLTSPKGFGLETATPLQRAICRVSDGVQLGKLWYHDEVRAAFGGVPPPEKPPKILVVLAAIRGAKTLIAAAKGVQASQVVSLELGRLNGRTVNIGVGDEVRIPILSVGKDQARQGFAHVRDNVMARPALRKLLIGEPTAESLMLRHPKGKAIEVQISAMAKAGASLVSRWLAGVVFDEAPRRAGVEDGAISLDDALAASAGRILHRGQTLLIGSPWAPFGPVYELVQEYEGKPTEDVVIVRAPGPAMNPIYWTPERCADLERRNPMAYRTDVLAQFADPEESLFSSIMLDEAQRTGPLVLENDPTHVCVAAMDPATRSNAWTLVIVDCDGLGGFAGAAPKYRVMLAKQWVGSKSRPLSPAATLQEIAAIVHSYGLTTAWTDQYASDALRDLASQVGLDLVENTARKASNLKFVEDVALLVNEGRLELPPAKDEGRVLRNDLLQAKKRVTLNGVTLVLPKSGDGRHCDFVPALALALAFPPDAPAEATPEVDEDFERARAEAEAVHGDWESLFARQLRH